MQWRRTTGSIRAPMAEPMRCSLNEIRTLAAKAARGAGLPWGVAEEAGRAACWLAARGLAGMSALDSALEGMAAPDWRRCFPVPEGAVWRADSGEIDALLAGMALADRAGGPLPFSGGGALVLARVRWPLLAVPFLAGVAQASGAGLAVSVGPGAPAIAIGAQSVGEACRALEGMAFAEAVRVEEASGGAMRPGLPRLDGGIPVERDVYARLDRRAARTYVPESAESRTRGAGAGDLADTD